MTSLVDLKFKLDEAEHFLSQMSAKPDRPEITYNFHAFANALYSVNVYSKAVGFGDPVFKQKRDAIIEPSFKTPSTPAEHAYKLVHDERCNDVHNAPSPARKQFKAVLKETVNISGENAAPSVIVIGPNDFEEHYYLGSNPADELFQTCRLALDLAKKLV